MSTKKIINVIPFVNWVTRKIYHLIKNIFNPFPGSSNYWENRYKSGGNSGPGSYGKLSSFKAETINSFVLKNCIKNIIEYGCGDGNQLGLANYPEYIGFDISIQAINICKNKFQNDSTKSFKITNDYNNETADLTLSLDVIYHLVEDCIFQEYMSRLFKSSRKFVIIYSSNTDDNSKFQAAHVRHRNFTKWIKKNIEDWELIQHIPNKFPIDGHNQEKSSADFYFYEKRA